MLRFYSTHISENTIVLDDNDSRHAIKVLRLTQGSELEIVDGFGNIYTSEIDTPNYKKCICKIVKVRKEQPLPYTLHIAVAPTKNIDRFEWFLEKATELGITEITPVLCSNSERKNIKVERLDRILISAMKQSLKATKPKLNPMTTIKDVLSKQVDGLKLMAYCEAGKKKRFSELNTSIKKITVFIGPEGDFTPKEIAFGKENGFIPLSLGSSRLRTETAALFSVASVYNTFT